MNRIPIGLTVIIGTAFLLSAGLPAVACTRLVPARQQGETEEQWMTRAHLEEQARFRDEAGSVFLAEVSMIRRVGVADIEISYTPLVHLGGGEMSTAALTIREHEGNTCRRDEGVGDEVVVYSRGFAADAEIIGLVSQTEILDGEMRRVIRAYHRGQLTLDGPIYPD